ncbi:MAG: hypothetical protein D6822_08435 [Cyanobacteria bacterium J149]|nr:MAG: hypothetical protein D6822_08435 [Cyanobacteria bacterium J149]
MPNMIDEQAIIDELYTLLSTINNVQVVYKGVPNSIGTYPAIIISENGWEEEYADLRDTTINMNLKIIIVVNLQDDTLTAQSTLRSIVKSVRSILGDQTNITLGGLIDSSRLTSGQYLFDQKESMQGICEITYNIRKRFSRV